MFFNTIVVCGLCTGNHGVIARGGARLVVGACECCHAGDAKSQPGNWSLDAVLLCVCFCVTSLLLFVSAFLSEFEW